MDEHDFSQLPPAAQAYIRELEARAAADAQRLAEGEARISELAGRIKVLEEQFRLARSDRFAPSSEKLKDRVFDEDERMAGTALADDDDVGDTFVLPDTGLPEVAAPAVGKRGRGPLPVELPRQHIEDHLPEDHRHCPCCNNTLHRMSEEISEQLHIAS
jgi:hypothetical protein